MLVCPHCNHANPEGATQCEACFTALPQLMACPHCGADVQNDATFCGSCGNSITPAMAHEIEPEAVSPGVAAEAPPPVPAPASPSPTAATQLQVQAPHFLHVQTETTLPLPQGLSVIHIGKPNERIPPDLDVSGFANSDVVSRVHADVRVEGDAYYLEDVGSANGTYINHTPLPPGNRHRLRAGDRISLGKGDLVTFIFQLA
ncbi:FHA domain-containing protein [Synechocystis sp. LKSZ1]|uniref:FHA domain-containing protein n=1 Tax=Synechocystis sp. LKSZ1 TaxID=3144951 RepID=UPI00336C173B